MVDRQDEICKNYGTETLRELKGEQRKFNIKFSPNSRLKAITVGYGRGFGVINRIGFKMPLHGVYLHKGVGRDTKAGQQGTTNRKAKEWFNPVIERTIGGLADAIAGNTGDAVTANIFIR